MFLLRDASARTIETYPSSLSFVNVQTERFSSLKVILFLLVLKIKICKQYEAKTLPSGWSLIYCRKELKVVVMRKNITVFEKHVI